MRRLLRFLPAALFALFAVGVLVFLGGGPFARNGDGWEYLVTLESLDRHASFDIRDDDIAAALARVKPDDLAGQPITFEAGMGMYTREANNPDAYRTTAAGVRYPLHFWLYPVVAYPAKLGLRLVGGQELNALRVTNGGLFLFGLGMLLFASKPGWERRVSLAVLVGVTPVVWYLPFTGAEVFSFGLIAAAMACYDRERYGLAALLAGLAATQNPPLVLVAGVCMLAALWRRKWGQSGWAVLGTGAAFLPVAFYLLTFGRPGLISDEHTNTKYIGLDRTLCLLFDLNIGLLPYVPLLVVAVAAAGLRLLLKFDVRALLIGAAVAGMLLGVQVQVNWNSDCRGMMRYLVWMLPPLAWIAAEGLPRWWLAGLAAAGTLASGWVLLYDPPSNENYLEHRPLARWVMTKAPNLYNPQHEVFVERQIHNDDAYRLDAVAGAPADYRVALPLGFGRDNGEITKILANRESAKRLTQRFVISPEYLPTLLAAAEASETPIYIHPPKRTVRAEPGTVHGAYNAVPFVRTDQNPWVNAGGK